MGTFHQGKSALHGITVVVDTIGEEIYVGRCDDELPEGVLLLDADLHRDGEGGKSKSDWLAAATRYGIWPRHPRLLVPADRVASVRRLADL